MNFIFLIIFFLFFPSVVLALPTFDTTSLVEVASSDTTSLNHTLGGGCTNSILIATIDTYAGDVAVSGVSTTAGAMTQLGSSRIGVDVTGSGDWWYQDTWYRLGVSGTQTVTVTMAVAVTGIVMTTRSYCGVNQSTPFGTAVAEADSTVDVSSVSGDLVIDSAWTNPQSTPISAQVGQTERYNYVASFAVAAGSDITGGGTITMSWTTSTDNTTMGVALKSVAVAAPSKRRAVIIQ